MSDRITNINTAAYETGESQRDEAPWRFLAGVASQMIDSNEA